MKVIKTISKIILNTLLVLEIILLIQAKVSTRYTISIFGFKTYVVMSNNMMPELKTGDVVIMKEDKKIESGDIVSIRNGKVVIINRIKEKKTEDDKILYTVEDNYQNNEIEIKKAQIEGRMIAKIPFVGNISLILREQAILVFIISISCLYLLYK